MRVPAPLALLGILLAAAGTAIFGSDAGAVTISGRITLGGAPLAGVEIMAPKGTCSATDGNGNYACTVSSGWNGTLAPYAPRWTFLLSGSATNAAAQTFSNLTTAASGTDFDATPAYGLRAEPVLYRPSTRLFLIDFDFNSNPDQLVSMGAAGDIPLLGDLNGDGIAELVLFRAGTWFADTATDGTADLVYNFGGAGDHPILGDVDGDGSADLGVFRSGVWYFSTQRTGVADRIYQFGTTGDVPVLGDFNGDGIADLAVVRNGVWFLDMNRDGVADRTIQFGGVAGEIPLALDFDGDGRSDLAIVRNGLWYVNTTLDGISAHVFGYGAAGDRPLGGILNRSRTRFVRAGSGCVSGCTQGNPYGTITAAWQEAVDGDILRIAKGTYSESLDFSYPGNQYLPGKFGKNNIKLLGVSKQAVSVSPSNGDAMYLRGVSGYYMRGMRFSSLAAGGRGIVLAGGPGSVLPSFPGAQFSLTASDATENGGQNVLLTGAANAWIGYTRMNRSRASHGISVWGSSYARIVGSEISGNGYTVAVGPPVPDAGKGLDVRDDSEGNASGAIVRQNLTFGVVSVVRSVVRLTSSTVEGSGYNGVLICGVATTPDQSVGILVNNWIAGNGFGAPTFPANGVEAYVTCSGQQMFVNNAFVGNALNGVFVGSGGATFTGNLFLANAIGATLYVDTTGFMGEPPSYANTAATFYGNTFDANSRVGIYAERHPGTTSKDVIATVGGIASNQKNYFYRYAPPRFHAIGCLNVTSNMACPVGGNFFDHSGDDVETPACNTACKSTP